MTLKNWSLGIDIGGTKIFFVQIDGNGTIEYQKKIVTNISRGFDAIFHEIIIEIENFISKAGTLPVAMGIGIAGQIENNTYLKRAPNLNWSNIPLHKLVYERWHIPTVIINDVRAATWCEWKFGAGRGVSDLICIMVGTGIGGGVIVQNRMLMGYTGGAGELGHFPVEMAGPPCTCGNRGCVEAFAGGWAFARHAKEAIVKNRSAGERMLHYVQGNLDNISAKEVFIAARDGDELAQQIILKAKEALISVCIGYANVFNPSHILLGGSLGLAFPGLCAAIQQGIKERSMDANRELVQVMPTAYKDDIVAMGAAGVALEKLNGADN